MKDTVKFSDALRFWLRLGLISFGGPAGQIAIMQKELVETRKWIAHDEFLHALNFCMLLPGPEAQQLATYIGWKLHGYRGGLAAGALFVIPSIILLLGLSFVYAAFGHIAEVGAVLNGFKAVVVAIVVEAVFKIAGRSLSSARHILVAITAFAAIFVFGIPFPLIVIGAAAFGIFVLRTSNPMVSETPTAQPRRTSLMKLFVLFAFLWFLPFSIFIAVFGFENRATESYLFFSKAAFVTFGGAYAVLAYVNQAVVAAGWITSTQAVDGLALAETTPGPLIMVLQFIGFMSGWNAADEENRIVFAIICALVATYATFLPSFFFIFAGAPHVERLRTNRLITSALSGVSAAIVGVIVNLALVFGVAVFFHSGTIDAFAVALAAAAFVALRIFKLNVLFIVIAGGLCGFAKQLLVG
ncbi:MAG: chromate efflux transporter [Acidobacteria bacterium]|nr:chromate efflux transporter [Acidobacteriota bacterium]